MLFLSIFLLINIETLIHTVCEDLGVIDIRRNFHIFFCISPSRALDGVSEPITVSVFDNF